MTIAWIMRKYNVYTFPPGVGRYELIKENPEQTGDAEEDYWNECFTWQDLKMVVPYFRSLGWKVAVEPVKWTPDSLRSASTTTSPACNPDRI